jgi:hypothetical protein
VSVLVDGEFNRGNKTLGYSWGGFYDDLSLHANPESSFREQQRMGRAYSAARPGIFSQAFKAAIAELFVDRVLGQPGSGE